jgi:hypothetical protein
MREWQMENPNTPIEQEMEQIGARDEAKKRERTQKGNQKRELLKPREVRIGKKVFIKNLVKRRKTNLPFCEPFVIHQILERNRFLLGRASEGNPRLFTRHINELRIRPKGREQG